MTVPSSPTVVACLTPRATGGIATVGLRGDDAWAIVEPLFQQRSRGPGQVLLGRFGTGQTDEVVVVRSPLEVEIHCHGGVAVVEWIIGLLTQRGAAAISWEEWVRQTASAPLQGEAASALAHALTARTASILLDQYHGAFDRAISAILDALTRREGRLAGEMVDLLVRRMPVGRHLTQPWRIVLTGAPNVGKSSLANALLGYQRSIISPDPGTTRDAVSSLTAVDGWPVEIIDTAGIRAAAVGLEAAGIARTQAAIAGADLVVRVLDQSAPPSSKFSPAADHVVVVNKIDLPAVWQPTGLRVSALTAAGVPELLRQLGQRLVPAPPTPGAAVPFTSQLCDALPAVQAQLASDQAAEAAAILRAFVSGQPWLRPAEYGRG